jgi:hypothetical protein
VLGEALVRRHGAADLLGEGRPLIWRGQLLDRQRGVEAADEVLEVEFVWLGGRVMMEREVGGQAAA